MAKFVEPSSRLRDGDRPRPRRRRRARPYRRLEVDDHLPLYRKAEIFARDGVSIETSTLSGWIGPTATLLKPLIDAVAADLFGSHT